MIRKSLVMAVMFALMLALVPTATYAQTTVIWEVNTGENNILQVDSDDGILIVNDNAGIIHAYDTETGNELWSHSTTGSFSVGLVVNREDNIIFAPQDNGVWALDYDGNVLWSDTSRNPSAPYALHDNGNYLQGNTTEVSATEYDKNNGDMQTHYELGCVGSSRGAFDNGDFYLSINGISRVDTGPNTCNLVWDSPTVQDGSLDVRVNNGYVYTDDGAQVDITDGSVVANYAEKADGASVDFNDIPYSFFANTTNDYIFATNESGDIVYNQSVGDTGDVTRFSVDSIGDTSSFYVANGTGGIRKINTTVESGGGTPTPTPSALRIEVDKWQPLNSSQSYSVMRGETDVTASSNVTSSNSTIISVDSSNQTLNSNGIVGRVTVTAEQNSENVTVNVTTGPRVLENIDIMPPEQWINSFLGIDDSGMHNIGSTTQWIIFIIIVAAAMGKSLDNDWVGLGSGLLTGIMLWVLEFIGLGLILSLVFFTIFVSMIKVRVNRQSGQMEVEINDTRDFRE